MKCPKCGYNSFEYLDTCKKCNQSLAAFKNSFGLHPVILPAAGIASACVSADESGISPGGETDKSDDIFQWDMPSPQPGYSPAGSGIEDFEMSLGDESNSQASQASDPFSFDEDLSLTPVTQSEQAEADPFEEFSFDLPATPADDIVSRDEPSGDPLHQEPADSIFGEVPFNESISVVHSGSSATVETGLNDQHAASGLQFDPFGDMGEEEFDEKSPAQPAASVKEFDLSSFLTMEDPSPAPVESASTATAGSTKLTGSEFEALFSELKDAAKKS